MILILGSIKTTYYIHYTCRNLPSSKGCPEMHGEALKKCAIDIFEIFYGFNGLYRLDPRSMASGVIKFHMKVHKCIF